MFQRFKQLQTELQESKRAEPLDHEGFNFLNSAKLNDLLVNDVKSSAFTYKKADLTARDAKALSKLSSRVTSKKDHFTSI